MRTFTTGATRNVDENKYDYEGFFSPLVVEAYGAYMHKHRKQADGNLRDSDNWQKGIPREAYMKSGFRHFIDWWKEHRGLPSQDGIVEAICALMFNAMGYLHEYLKEREGLTQVDAVVPHAITITPLDVSEAVAYCHANSKRPERPSISCAGVACGADGCVALCAEHKAMYGAV